MRLFLKHEVQENDGEFEILLFLDKEKPLDLFNDDFNSGIKKAATLYITEKLTAIPIKVIRIMIGSVPYFSFVNTKQD